MCSDDFEMGELRDASGIGNTTSYFFDCLGVPDTHPCNGESRSVSRRESALPTNKETTVLCVKEITLELCLRGDIWITTFVV